MNWADGTILMEGENLGRELEATFVRKDLISDGCFADFFSWDGCETQQNEEQLKVQD